jgi:hypothetical protein
VDTVVVVEGSEEGGRWYGEPVEDVEVTVREEHDQGVKGQPLS